MGPIIYKLRLDSLLKWVAGCGTSPACVAVWDNPVCVDKEWGFKTSSWTVVDSVDSMSPSSRSLTITKDTAEILNVHSWAVSLVFGAVASEIPLLNYKTTSEVLKRLVCCIIHVICVSLYAFVYYQNDGLCVMLKHKSLSLASSQSLICEYQHYKVLQRL